MADYVVSHTSRRREVAEAAVADLVERKILVLRHEPVVEALVRSAVSRVLTGNFTPSVEALGVLKRRLKASRFAVASH